MSQAENWACLAGPTGAEIKAQTKTPGLQPMNLPEVLSATTRGSRRILQPHVAGLWARAWPT